MQLLKVGGNELDQPGFLNDLAGAVATLDEPAVIVHGGGRAIAAMESRLGLSSIKVDGLRVTNAQSLVVSQMVLSGQANKNIVAAFLVAGVDAVGLSGVDGGLLRCVKKQHPAADLGYVGHIVDVRSRLVQTLVDQGITPVISPISLGVDGQIYNVNADEAAGAIAAAMNANVLNFISDVPGVLDNEGRPFPKLSPAQTQNLMEQGVIRNGMVPKVKAALKVLDLGVPKARILNLDGLLNGSGTLISR
jgi:acetylglutamate kinase